MKKLIILFIIVAVINLVMPMFWCFSPEARNSQKEKELITIFSGEANTGNSNEEKLSQPTTD